MQMILKCTGGCIYQSTVSQIKYWPNNAHMQMDAHLGPFYSDYAVALSWSL